MKKILSVFLAGVVVLMGWFQMASAVERKNTWPLTNIHKAIVSESRWLNVSQALTEEDLRGRIILLDFWTFCCINCMHVIPDLVALEHEFGDKLTVIGVHSAKFLNEKDTENIRSAILRYGIEHPVVNDGNFAIWQRFGVRAWPSLILIGPEGRIVSAYSGEGHREELRQDISALLRKYGDSIIHTPLPVALEKNKAAPSVLSFPGKLAYGENAEGQTLLFVSDSSHHRILAFTLSGQVVSVIGSGKPGSKDGSFETAEFFRPQGMAYKNGVLYVADTGNHLIRKVDFREKKVETIAGTGQQGHERRVKGMRARSVPLASPWDVAFYPDDNTLVIAMAGTHQLWTYDIAGKTVSVLAGNGSESIDDGVYPNNSLSQPSGLSVVGDTLYFVDAETSALRALDRQGKLTTLIGTGLFDFGYAEGKRGKGLLQHPLGLFADTDTIYIADSYNHAVRRYDPKTEELRHFAGNGARGDADGELRESRFNEPNDALKISNLLYVADTNNHAIRVINFGDKSVSTLNLSLPAASHMQPAASLPNLAPLVQGAVAAGPVTLKLKLELEKGWKINDQAPSWLALFDGEQSVQSWNAAALKQSSVFSLPPLKEGKKYILQGTFYYCQDKEGSLCLIRSIHAPLEVKQGAKKEIIIPLESNR